MSPPTLATTAPEKSVARVGHPDFLFRGESMRCDGVRKRIKRRTNNPAVVLVAAGKVEM